MKLVSNNNIKSNIMYVILIFPTFILHLFNSTGVKLYFDYFHSSLEMP